MRVRVFKGLSIVRKPSARIGLVFGGVSSVALIAMASATTGPFQSTKQSSSNATTSSKTLTEIRSNDESDLKTVESGPVEQNQTESYTQSADGSSQTREYQTTIQQQDGTQTTRHESYTTNTDGSSAIGINLNSSSSTTGISNSNSTVRLNVESRSEVKSSN